MGAIHTAAPVLVETRGSALWVAINRPERRNAMNGDVLSGIAGALDRAENDGSVRAVVLTGTGEKAFCAGADLTDGADAFTDQLAEPTTEFGRLARRARLLGKPLVARVNGACVAGGMALLAMCDLAVAAEHARFGLPEVKVGVFPVQVAVYLRHTLTRAQLAELAFTGALVDAPRAAALGLVSRVVPSHELDTTVDTITTEIGLGSPQAIRRGRYALAAMNDMSFEEALAFAETQIAVLSRTTDAREGLAAFNERRPPAWQINRQEQA